MISYFDIYYANINNNYANINHNANITSYNANEVTRISCSWDI